ncbi:class I SAM-dependent methyltransferase [Planococcus sp. CAU13]|uniref:class I SAM-dependent methyltransferase n=1 Tax=Planococcus sp. CAU13 TaxID=1541197 RepID=UPI00052FED12|nr:class I SAM-dependent methyltransferase [Planococcus sp. CAU13]
MDLKKHRLDHLLESMKIIGDDTIQRTQLKHRMSLVETLGLEPGMRILEIGCGQGDTTVVLADAAGEDGYVLAVDIADPDYGAPITLGEATTAIAASQLGSQIDFRLQTDLLDLPEDSFDVAVLSHSSWYFRDSGQLLAYFRKMRRMAKRICIAEWNLNFTRMEQRPHFAATAILALYSEFIDNEGNIQHVFDSLQLQTLLKEAGWTVQELAVVEAGYLQDGAWEVDYALSIREGFSSTPQRIQSLASSLYALLEADEIDSLDSIVIVAE